MPGGVRGSGGDPAAYSIKRKRFAVIVYENNDLCRAEEVRGHVLGVSAVLILIGRHSIGFVVT